MPTPFQFDILAELANIPDWIIIHEFLHLSKEFRDALREALINSESFIVHLPKSKDKETGAVCQLCHQVIAMPSITFTLENVLIKDPNHDRQLYYIGYINTAQVERVVFNLGSTLNIIPIFNSYVCQ